LTSDQLIALIKYIVEESIQLYPDGKEDDNQVSTDRQSSIANRIDLLMLCISEKQGNLQRVVTFIRDIPSTSR
jgi:hypothetical protein